MKLLKRLAAKHTALLIGSLLIFLGIIHLLTSSLTSGTLLTCLLGAIFLIYGCFYTLLSRILPKWLKTLFVLGCVFVTVFVSAVYICGSCDNVTYNEDALIVLGAGIKGEEVGANLEKRLDTAVKYYESNPDCVIVVSGGQGANEDITEALAMERYLTSRGVPQEKIIKEERSTSTVENFAFSKLILDERFGENGYTAAFVTNTYHICRANMAAEGAGFAELTHVHAKTPWYVALPNGLREMLGIVRAWLLG